MSRKYDHHWKKGLGKPGEPLGIPTARAAFFSKQAAKKRGRKGRPGGKLAQAEARLAAAVENLGRIAAVAGPILAEAGIPPGGWVPPKLATDLMLAGNDFAARFVTAYARARGEVWHAEREVRGVRAGSAPPRPRQAPVAAPQPPNGVKPPWED